MHWKEGWFVHLRVPVNYWDDQKNQRNFLLEFASKNGVNQHSDWGKITTRHLIDSGGYTLLNRFGISVYRTLKGVFSGLVVITAAIETI